MATFNSIRFAVAASAAKNYRANIDTITLTRDRIEQNKRGTLSLSEITEDPSRLDNRIARVGFARSRKEALERINGIANFQDTIVLNKLENLARVVCRISLYNGNQIVGYGTGFLAGNNLLITNHHVLPDAATAAVAIAEFDYEVDDYNVVKATHKYRVKPDVFFMTSSYEENSADPASGLDFTLVALEEISDTGRPLADFGYTPLDYRLGKIIEGENCVVIQHPEGNLKKVVLKDIRLLNFSEKTLVYESDTLPGSSGSMVIGLGTGEVVALHHSGVPRTDDQGNWLRKDGTVAGPNDPDELIDWIGNEGIRISRLVEAIQQIPLEPAMEKIRRQLIELHQNNLKKFNNQNMSSGETNTRPVNTPSSPDTARIQHFEVILTDNAVLRESWNAAVALLPGFVRSEKLLPSATHELGQKLYYLTLRSNEHPWKLAEQIETMSQVKSCTPDLELMTDAGLSEANKPRNAEEAFGFLDSIFHKRTEIEKFRKNWGTSKWVQESEKVSPEFYKQWHWSAIRHPWLSAGNFNFMDEYKSKLSQLRFVQLDTGFSHHPKVFSSYNLDVDMDFIDAEEDKDGALDEMARGFLRHPGHGTRTASLSVGVLHPDISEDGNLGVLAASPTTVAANLIPYRISQSVILVGRGRELVDAALHAIRNGTDVMFMCMGTLPKTMFDVVAREAYENGVIWVCAAGNQVRFVIAPACYPGTIAVAAINPDDRAWSGSCRGEAVDISAPGEDLYVPTEEDGKLTMSFGSGTSYATPQVASAAMLWKAKNMDVFAAKGYTARWQIVEAFRICLYKSARPNALLEEGKFGKGVLDLTKLLEMELPGRQELKHAYTGKPMPEPHDIGEREVAHNLWNGLAGAASATGRESMVSATAAMTERAKLTLKSYRQSGSGMLESSQPVSGKEALNILESYFKPY